MSDRDNILGFVICAFLEKTAMEHSMTSRRLLAVKTNFIQVQIYFVVERSLTILLQPLVVKFNMERSSQVMNL